MEKLYTVGEAAAVLHVSEEALLKRIWRRQIESIKSGRYRLIRESAIEAYLRKNTDKVRR